MRHFDLVVIGAGPLRKPLDVAGDFHDRLFAGLPDDRDDQPVFGVHGDPDVVTLLENDLAALLVEGGVHRGVDAQGGDGRLDQERQEGDLHSFALSDLPEGPAHRR